MNTLKRFGKSKVYLAVLLITTILIAYVVILLHQLIGWWAIAAAIPLFLFQYTQVIQVLALIENNTEVKDAKMPE